MTERESRYRAAFTVLGALVLVMGLALVSQSLYFNHRLDKQNQSIADQSTCIADNFHKLTVTLTARGNFAAEDTKHNQDVIFDVAKAKTSSDFVKALADYKAAVAKTAKKREEHPIPPFPKGKCG